jgi:hypothetical protein
MNLNRHLENTDKLYHIPSYKPFIKVYENATYNKPFLGLLIL